MELVVFFFRKSTLLLEKNPKKRNDFRQRLEKSTRIWEKLGENFGVFHKNHGLFPCKQPEILTFFFPCIMIDNSLILTWKTN